MTLQTKQSQTPSIAIQRRLQLLTHWNYRTEKLVLDGPVKAEYN